MIVLDGISKSYRLKNGPYEAVHSVSLQVFQGEIHGIIGTSGAGKSTLLRMINLLESPSTGHVRVNDLELTQLTTKNLRKARRSIGMVFQAFNLVHNRSVKGNVLIPLELAGFSKQARLERAAECLRIVGLERQAEQYPSSLSGGQKQRVAIARALATNPTVLLCDEPTSSLDPQTTEEILKVLKEINRNFGVTIVIVTHEMDVIKSICNKVSIMEAGEIIETISFEPKGFAALKNDYQSLRRQLLSEVDEDV
ncbi:ATP-binding cassette domain-containing protein [Peribacillus psychrosaccharolyticus]|uniref:methionine ABC transporter ATP-binding protein n=1 Tax=Peribacillus psychrosaccharolyticus TaxID=1407 RepID=UPI003D290609